MILSYSEKQFLDLVKLSLNDIPVPESLMDEIDWDEIYAHAKNQAVVGIVFDAIKKLPQTKKPQLGLFLKWFGQTKSISNLNYVANQGIKEVVGKYRQEGLDAVLLKGQGLAQYYPNPTQRQPGDIDLYFFDRYNDANKTAATWEDVVFLPDTSYHRAFFYKGIQVENHLVYVDFYNNRNRKAWKKIEKEIPLTSHEELDIDGFRIKVPQPQINVLYVFLHSMHHMLQVGIGLRQICDWVCLWKCKHQEIDNELLIDCVKRLRIERSFTAMAYIAEEYLGLEKGIIPFDTSTKRAAKDGKMMICDIIESGNFGHNTEIMKGFERNKHFNNLKSYYLALIRQIRLYNLYPSEVIAYPQEWIKQKFKGK